MVSVTGRNRQHAQQTRVELIICQLQASLLNYRATGAIIDINKCIFITCPKCLKQVVDHSDISIQFFNFNPFINPLLFLLSVSLFSKICSVIDFTVSNEPCYIVEKATINTKLS